MKKLITIFVIMLTIITFKSQAQEVAFTVDMWDDFSIIDLTNASQTAIGTITPTFGGMDFGPDNVLYGLDYNTNELFEVDTTDGSTTLIGSSVPPSTHIWTGMAYDAASGIMYANASHGISAGSSNLYTIDLTDGSITLIGSQTDVTAIGCIAFDDTGQLYGLELSASPSIYLIDITDASVTYLGDCGSFGGAGMGYGMDYYSETQTMYLTAYDSFTFNSNLYTVDLTDGSVSDVGFLSGWTFALAIVSPFTCDFSADETTICAGSTVNFTDESTGADSWEWTFEGGTPATSTDQDPSVTYNTAGIYDVTLEITNSAGSTKSESKSDYINVIETPAQAATPEGDDAVCTGQIYNYSIEEVLYAGDYEWELTPTDAGTLTPNENTAELSVDDEWTGDFTIRVRATNMCGDGAWSDFLEATVNESPLVYTLEGGGGYCLDGDGVEITLNGSDSGVDYELYLNDEPTGNIVEGTGSEISFGWITEEGYYTANANNANCGIIMNDQLEVYIMFPPLEPATPTGPELVCNDETSDYESEGSEDADSYIWILTPESAGILTPDGLTATVSWSLDFSGIAELSLAGVNDCGEGNPATALEVTIDAVPMPEISGAEEVCDNHSEVYTTDEFENGQYTWEVTSGTISEGQGTNSIIVAWGDAGEGIVSVSIDTEAGCSGSSDEFNVFIDDCTGVNENNLNRLISVNPNPANDFVVVNSETLIMDVSILQMGSGTLQYQIVNSNQVRLNTSLINSGIYILKVNTDKGIIIKKLVIK